MRLGDRQSNQHDRNLQREFPSVDEIAVEEIRVVARRRPVDAEDLDKVAQLPVQVADDGEALGNHGRDVVDARLALEHLEILGEDDEHVFCVEQGVLVLFGGRHRLVEVVEHFEHRLEGQRRGQMHARVLVFDGHVVRPAVLELLVKATGDLFLLVLERLWQVFLELGQEVAHARALLLRSIFDGLVDRPRGLLPHRDVRPERAVRALNAQHGFHEPREVGAVAAAADVRLGRRSHLGGVGRVGLRAGRVIDHGDLAPRRDIVLHREQVASDAAVLAGESIEAERVQVTPAVARERDRIVLAQGLARRRRGARARRAAHRTRGGDEGCCRERAFTAGPKRFSPAGQFHQGLCSNEGLLASPS